MPSLPFRARFAWISVHIILNTPPTLRTHQQSVHHHNINLFIVSRNKKVYSVCGAQGTHGSSLTRKMRYINICVSVCVFAKPAAVKFSSLFMYSTQINEMNDAAETTPIALCMCVCVQVKGVCLRSKLTRSRWTRFPSTKEARASPTTLLLLYYSEPSKYIWEFNWIEERSMNVVNVCVCVRAMC